jgi:hypothetical protein
MLLEIQIYDNIPDLFSNPPLQPAGRINPAVHKEIKIPT